MRPGIFSDWEEERVGNPLGVDALGGVAGALEQVSITLTFVLLLTGIVSIGVRFRRAQGVERMQLRWIVTAGTAIGLTWLLMIAMSFVIPEGPVIDTFWAISLLSIGLLPIGVGFAVLRYRLYDIDRVISKALVYAAVTAVLVLGVRRPRPGGSGALLVVRRRLEPGDRGVDAGGRRSLPARALPGAALRRPPLLPPPLRRAAHARELRRTAARADRPLDARGGSQERRRRDDAAEAHVPLAASGGTVVRRPPWTSWLAWAAFTLTLALYAVGITIQEIRGESAATQQESWIAKIGLLLAFLGFAAVGALVASRQPRNAVGWIFSAIGLLVSVSLAAGEWAGYTFEEDPGSLPGGTVAGWLYLWAWFPAIGLIAFVPLLFPDGRVPGPRWRVVQWGLATLIALITVVAWFVPGPMNADETPPWPDNPLGLGVVEDVSDSLSALPAIAFLLLVGASVASMVVRFRRSRGDERQQLKWMTLAVVVLALSVGIPEAARRRPRGSRVRSRSRAPPGVGRHSDAEVPPVRRRRRDPQDARLRAADGGAGGDVRRAWSSVRRRSCAR